MDKTAPDREMLRTEARRLAREVWDGDESTLPALRFDFVGRHGSFPRVRSIFEVAAAERRRMDLHRRPQPHHFAHPRITSTD